MNTHRKRCGKCFKRDGTFIPVIVTSSGEFRETYAHAECIPLWANTVDIRVDPNRANVVQAKLEPCRRRVHARSTPTYSIAL